MGAIEVGERRKKQQEWWCGYRGAYGAEVIMGSGLRMARAAEWTDMSENEERGQSWMDTSAGFAEPGWRTGAQRTQWGSWG